MRSTMDCAPPVPLQPGYAGCALLPDLTPCIILLNNILWVTIIVPLLSYIFRSGRLPTALPGRRRVAPLLPVFICLALLLNGCAINPVQAKRTDPQTVQR